MSSKDLVLLGFIDTPIPVTDNCNYQVNKVGGVPDWMTSESDVRSVVCSLCSRESALVCQIYCPLGQNSSHRTLYLFCCLNHHCWNKSESWTVLRCQQGSQTNIKAGEEAHEVSSTWLTSQDNWDEDISEDASTDGLCSATENLTLPHTLVSAVVQNSELAMDDDSNESDSSAKSMSQVIPEPLSASFAGELPWKVLGSNTRTLAGKNILCSFYISVSEESTHEANSSEHIDTLWQNYQQHAGNPFYKTKTSSPSSDGSSHGTESYEKSEVKHGDKCFYKFQKRLSKLPQQIVRYQWGGQPLLICPRGEDLPSCQSCGAPRVFEFQLMPTLVPSLKLQGLGKNNNDPPVEFGTVIVSSCVKSCWQDGDIAKTENVLVQSDPDENLFQA